MKTFSILFLVFITSFVLIKGQRNDTIKDVRIDNLPNIERQNEVIKNDLDSLAERLEIELKKAMELQNKNDKFRQKEIESETKLIKAQEELIITLLENEHKGISKE